MRGRLLIFILLTAAVRPLISSDAWIDSTIDLTINTKFDRALRILHNQLKADPADYRVQFYLAATLNSRMTHFENQKDELEFEQAIDSTIRIITHRMEQGDTIQAAQRAEMKFYLASAYGYLAYYQGRTGNFIPALSNGIKANNLFYDAIALDSTLYDAYLGIGTFKYWRYSKLAFISWLPFIPDDRDEGIALIRKCIVHGTRSRYLAMHQLVYILVDYGETEKAVELGRQLVDRYPQSQFMWWAAARAYEKNGSYEQAVQAYKKLMALLESDPVVNPNHLIKCGIKLAEVYQLAGAYSECYQLCATLINRMKRLDVRDKDDRLNAIAGMMNTCRESLTDSGP